MAEESAELRIGDIRMRVQRVEVVGQIHAGNRDAGSVFLKKRDDFGKPHVR